MKHFHSNSIFNSLIKPSKIFFDDDKIIKINSFDLFYSCPTRTVVKDLTFIAPEVIKDGKLDVKNDSYIFGCIVYFVLNGSITTQSFSKKLRGEIPKIPPNFNDFTQSLVLSCLSYDPEDRPSIDLILDEMENSNYNLIDLKESEIEDVKKFVKSHKEKIST